MARWPNVCVENLIALSDLFFTCNIAQDSFYGLVNIVFLYYPVSLKTPSKKEIALASLLAHVLIFLFTSPIQTF